VDADNKKRNVAKVQIGRIIKPAMHSRVFLKAQKFLLFLDLIIFLEELEFNNTMSILININLLPVRVLACRLILQIDV